MARAVLDGDVFQLRQEKSDPWEEVPLTHWRYYAGYRMRRLIWDLYSIGGRYDGSYQYATYEQCARQTLEETYG